MNFKSLNIEIVDICNLHCQMCDIWQNKNAHFITIDDINNILLWANIWKDLDICLTGWEPFLHPKIINLIEHTHALGYSVNTISTNGMFLEKSIKLITQLRKKHISIPDFHISIDGMQVIHDTQRGSPGSFKKSIECIQKLSQLWVKVKIKYTITPLNINDIFKCDQLAKKLSVDILYKLVESDENYTNRNNTPSLLNNKQKDAIAIILKKIHKSNNTYMQNMLFFMEHNLLPFDCKTPHTNLFIMAKWDVYTCTKYPKIWNIKDKSINEIFGNSTHRSIIKKVEEIHCSKCFSLHWAYKTIKNEVY